TRSSNRGRRVRNHLRRGLGTCLRTFDVAYQIARDAVEAVRVAVLAGECRGGRSRIRLERCKRTTIVGDVDREILNASSHIRPIPLDCKACRVFESWQRANLAGWRRTIQIV